MERAFFLCQPLRDFIEENLPIESFVALLTCSKTLYGSYERRGAALESPPRRAMSHLYWSRYVLRPSISKTEFALFLNELAQRAHDSHPALQFQYTDRRAALYFYFNPLALKLYRNVDTFDACCSAFSSTRLCADEIWRYLYGEALVQDNRLCCNTLQRRRANVDIHRIAFDRRLSFATEQHQAYLQHPLYRGEPKTLQRLYDKLIENAHRQCNKEKKMPC